MTEQSPFLASSAHAFAASAAAYPELLCQLGQRGREACAEDIGYHLDFLRPVLETGDLSSFNAYLGWLSDVLFRRGIPADSLPRSLDDLAAFFAAALGCSGAPVVADLLAQADAALYRAKNAGRNRVVADAGSGVEGIVRTE